MARTTRNLLLASQPPSSPAARTRSSPSAVPRLALGVSAALLRSAKDQGTELLAAGNLEAALAAFQQVAGAAPNEPTWRQKVAEILQKLGRTREAIAEYEAAASAWARTGWLLRAIALCKIILQLDPKHTRTQALLANLHAREQPRGLPQSPERARTTPPGLRTRVPLRPAEESVPAAPQAHIPFFTSLGREVFLEVLSGVERRVCQPGEVIVQEGALGSSMFIIAEGEVRVMRQDEAGQSISLATLGEGQFFGEMALLCKGPRLSTVVASTQAVLLEFSRERMEEIATRHPQLSEVVHRLYRQRLLANALRSNPLFAGWPNELRQKVSEAFKPVPVKEGEEILTRGQPSHALYLLLRGRCVAFHQHVDGRETPYPDLAEGDVFGEISLLRSKLVTASVRAMTPCLLLKLEWAVLEQLLPLHPILHKELQRLGAERMLRTTMLLCGRPIHLGDTRV